MALFLVFFVAIATASQVKGQTVFLDIDEDGRLSKPEVLGSMTLEQAMVALDKDGDGNLTPLQVYELLDDHSLFHFLDLDSDHRVSFDEVHAITNMAAIFDREDTNADGFLDGPEADKLAHIYVEIFVHGANNWARDRIDTDTRDQRLSRQEVLNAITLDQVFAAVDADGDGRFTQLQIIPIFGPTYALTFDANEDGMVSFGEFRAVLDMGGFFDVADTDGDGYLEGPEQFSIIGVYNLIVNMAAAYRTDPALDTDGDGRLSKGEVVRAMTLDQIMLASDRDGDGQFTEIDILQYFDREFLQKFDADGDGFVTFDEMRAVITVGSFFDYCDADDSGYLESLEQYKVLALFKSVQHNDYHQSPNPNRRMSYRELAQDILNIISGK